MRMTFVGLRLVAGDRVDALLDQLLDQLGPRGLVLDQHDRRPEPLVLPAHVALQLRVFHAPAQQVDQIEVIAGNAPGRADAEIAELGRLVGGVPALHDALELLRQRARLAVPEPGRFDQAAAQWRGGLLVLAGEIVFADHMAEVLEHRQRLAGWMQCLAVMPGQQFRSQDRIHGLRLVGLGDRRTGTTSQSSCASTWPTRSSSCRRCMISTIAPASLSLNRL
jgi:hypothetical protein